MSLTTRCGWVLAAALVGSMGIDAQKGPALPDLRRAAADYVLRYAQQLSAVAAEEDSLQLNTSAQEFTPRHLRSDVVLVGLDDGFVAGFRDVFEENGAAAAQRQVRPLTRFRMPPTAALLAQARALSVESRRRYISPALGLLDEPTLPLQCLARKNQARFTFTLESVSTMDGSQVAVLRFEEQGTPRLIPSPDNTPVSGRLWIDVVSGAVTRTELVLRGTDFEYRTTVTYKMDPTLRLWLPVGMQQRVDLVTRLNSDDITNSLIARQSFEARTTYSAFRFLRE